MRSEVWLALGLLVAACAPVAPSPSSVPVSQSSAPKRLVAAITGEAHTLYQKMNPSSTVRGIENLEQLVSAGMANVDDRGERRPQLAEAVPSLENGLWKVFPDGKMQTTWRLRDGARWHDGAPVTVDDLLFTLRMGQDREIPNLRSIAFNAMEGAEALDARTVILRWTKPYIEADDVFTSSTALPMPKHLLEAPYLTDKASFTDLPFWSHEFVGSGPFRLKEWVRGSHMVFAAFDEYVLGRPKIDEIEVRFILDSNTLIANVLAGAVDVTLGRGISTEQAIQVREQWREGVIAMAPSSWLVIYPQFLNPSPPVVADLRFRRALMHGIDRQALVDSLQFGFSSVAHAFLNPNEPEYAEIEGQILRYEYAPGRAAQLIEGLGYAKGADGVYREGSGQKLAVELRTITTDINQKTLFAVTDYWQRLGVEADPVVVPTQRQPDLPYRSTFPAFDLLRQPNDLTSVNRLHSSEARLPENNFVGGNNARYMSLELDSLIERFFTTIPRGDRIRIGGEIIRHTTENLSLMGLLYDTEPALISKRLKNAGARKVRGSAQTWNAEQWEVV